ncbi:MAG: hypothetical protein ABI583_08540, partial [Betaproteobacteria bacterium]
DTDNASRITTVNIVSLEKNPGGHSWQLAAWVRKDGAWQFVADTAGMGLSGRADAVSVRFQFAFKEADQKLAKVIAFAVDRFGNESARVVWPDEAGK